MSMVESAMAEVLEGTCLRYGSDDHPTKKESRYIKNTKFPMVKVIRYKSVVEPRDEDNNVAF
jgi:hypothetical protein